MAYDGTTHNNSTVHDLCDYNIILDTSGIITTSLPHDVKQHFHCQETSHW